MALLTFDRNPHARLLRQFAGIWLPAAIALVGWSVHRRTGVWNAAVAIWVSGAVLSLVAFVRPAVARVIWVGWMSLAFPIGWALSHVVLATVYYAGVWPTGIAVRLLRRDPLTRAFDPRATTYWRPHNPGGHPERYFRQF